jgi:hypothetical protein
MTLIDFLMRIREFRNDIPIDLLMHIGMFGNSILMYDLLMHNGGPLDALGNVIPMIS